MIPFASQRGGGQDLATHLMNEHDNEYMELTDIRGAIAGDLHGAFAEWAAQASAMTKCRNYLYSLSINPDPANGLMPRELYDDYIGRVEAALGLDGQPRAVVYHIKEDKKGIAREHCHVVWSRIDIQDMKAIHMSFDHDKLMTVTRQFARDHDIELAPGYHNLEDRARQTHRQLSLYDKAQQDAIGLTREDRTALVTELWKLRDTPGSFVKALEYHGYVLAEGNRPYVLVDIHGGTNSLPKLIDDKSANTAAIRAFLGDQFSGENLPSVDDAKSLAAQHRQALKDHKVSQDRADKIDQLKIHQAERRAKLEKEIAARSDQHQRGRQAVAKQQLDTRAELRSSYLETMRSVRLDRHAKTPRGLAGFLAKITGAAMVRHKLHRYQDKKRHDAYRVEKRQLQDRQVVERDDLRKRHEMQSLDQQRKLRGLDQVEKRERRSLEMTFQRQRNVRYRQGYEHMPTLNLNLKPRGRFAVPHKAMNRHSSRLGDELEKTIRRSSWTAPSPGATMQDQFARAARGDDGHESRGGVSDGKASDASHASSLSRQFKANYRPNDRGRKR